MYAKQTLNLSMVWVLALAVAAWHAHDGIAAHRWLEAFAAMRHRHTCTRRFVGFVRLTCAIQVYLDASVLVHARHSRTCSQPQAGQHTKAYLPPAYLPHSVYALGNRVA